MRLTFALLLCACPALAQTFPVGTLLICRMDGAATGQTIGIAAPGVYVDQSGRRGGYIWDHRGFDFISGPFAGATAEARPGLLRLTPQNGGGRTWICSE